MDQNQNKRNPFKTTIVFILVFLALMGIFQTISGRTGLNKANEITSSQFFQELEDGKIEKMEIQVGSGAYIVKGEYKNKTEVSQSDEEDIVEVFKASKDAQTFETKLLGNDATLERVTDQAMKTNTKLKTLSQSQAGEWLSLIPFILMMLPALYLIYSMARQGGGGGNTMNFGKSKARDVSKEISHVKFDDVAGCEEEKQELIEIVDFLKNPKRYTDLGARIPTGVLLEGPPGTGKTLLAKAVAGEAGVPFFSISGSEFVEMFVGVGASRVRDLFEKAKKEAPAIIFIDEIDAVGRQRGAGMGGGHDEREQTLNQLLVEMDGFSGNEGVIVMAATNRADVLDPALLRPGRFDRQILVGNPDVKGREEILRVHSRNKTLSDDIDLAIVAQQTPGFSGADLENLLNEAALVAARRNHEIIEQVDINEAHDRVIAGVAQDRTFSSKQRRTVAYHEAGHTICGMVLDSARIVHKVTIVPRGRAGGYAIMLPREDQFVVTERELYEQVVGLLGGRAGEEVEFGEISTGASDDFKQATKIVRSMVTEYGMSEKLGTIQYEGNDQPFAGRQYGSGNGGAYSEQTAYEIDQEVRRIMDQAYEEALSIIKDYREQHALIAEKLLEVETLDRLEIESLFYKGHMPGEEPVEESVEDESVEGEFEEVEGGNED